MPLLGSSKPAIIRSVVVLPEPDGPSIVKNSPWAISRSIPATATTSPYFLVSPDKRMSSCCSLYAWEVIRSGAESKDKVARVA